jgi:DNA-directed RNA polymerase subunit RPC12/RpoP
MKLVYIMLVGAVATALATSITSALSRRWSQTHPLPASRDANPPMAMPRLGLFRVERRTRPVVRVLALAMILTVVLAKATSPASPAFSAAAILEVVGIVALSIGTLLIDATIRCRECGHRMLLESRESPPYPPPRKQVDVLGAGGFQCMYCGQRYITQTGVALHPEM